MNSEARIYIIGAGFAGQAIAREIADKSIFGRVVAFLDDAADKIGAKIDGIPVLGPVKDVILLLKQTPADEAIIAIPSATRQQLQDLYSLLKSAGFSKIRILPGISQILEGEAHLIQARAIDPQDFLGRTPVSINLKESLTYLRGKRVLITGAGGSIGSELCRQLLSGGAERLYLFGHGENSIYEIDRELRLLQREGIGEKAVIVPIIGDIQDRDYIRFILKRLKADVVFHCAASKHVPMVEDNPVEGIKNNVFGTKNLVEAALDSHVSRFVLISTDKAVDPASVYGVSKFLAERIVLQAQAPGKRFMVVRFGNVLGSRGSIIPLFRNQILNGGPVTVTHPETNRYFMTIPEASTLVLKTGGVGDAQTLYLLDMGEPLSIKDLAEQMIRFYGYQPETDIKIEYIGLRPGEKMNEHLWSKNESPVATKHPGINRASFTDTSLDVTGILTKLEPICFFDPDQPDSYRNRKILRTVLQEAAPSLRIPDDEPTY